jgi:hypothetical protein
MAGSIHRKQPQNRAPDIPGAAALGYEPWLACGYRNVMHFSSALMKSPGQLWNQIRRDLGRGWAASYHDYRTLRRIEEWYWPLKGGDLAPVPVHIVAGSRDWRLAAWALASLFHCSERAWPVVIHNDGTLPEDGRAMLQRLFSECRVISREEADARMKRTLRPFPYCNDFRQRGSRVSRVFELAHFAAGERFVMVDSHVLFFSYPREIIEWIESPSKGECWFPKNPREGSLIDASEAFDELGVKLWPQVGTGLGFITKTAIDFDFCDLVLATTTLLENDPLHAEQTLFALCASRHGKGGLLPASYEVSVAKHAAPDVVARHYLAEVEDLFYSEGLKRLCPELLAVEEV